MQQDVSGPMERLHHRNRMQTASPPPPRVLIEYAKSLLRAPPIREISLGTDFYVHSEWRTSFPCILHFVKIPPFRGICPLENRRKKKRTVSVSSRVENFKNDATWMKSVVTNNHETASCCAEYRGVNVDSWFEQG